MADVKKLAEELVNLKVTEVNELATILKEEYGIEPAAAAVVKDSAGRARGAAKALVDGAPKAVKEGVSKEEAESIKAQLEEAGAEVELK